MDTSEQVRKQPSRPAPHFARPHKILEITASALSPLAPFPRQLYAITRVRRNGCTTKDLGIMPRNEREF